MNETLPPDKYYLGDPSYVLNNILYYEILGDIYHFKNGKYDLLNNDKFIVMHNTSNGDGIYYDTKNRRYSVESGLIALVPVTLIDNENISNAKKFGSIFNFEKIIEFTYHKGFFTIKSGKYIIEINTINKDEYDSDSDDDIMEESKKKLLRNDDDDSSLEGSCEEDNNDDDDTLLLNKKGKFKSFFKTK